MSKQTGHPSTLGITQPLKQGPKTTESLAFGLTTTLTITEHLSL